MFRRIARAHLYKLPIVIQDSHPRKLERIPMYVPILYIKLKNTTYDRLYKICYI